VETGDRRRFLGTKHTRLISLRYQVANPSKIKNKNNKE